MTVLVVVVVRVAMAVIVAVVMGVAVIVVMIVCMAMVMVRVVAAVMGLLSPLSSQGCCHPLGQVCIGLGLQGIDGGQWPKAHVLEACSRRICRGLASGEFHELAAAFNRNLLGRKEAHRTHEGGRLGGADDMEFDAIHGFTLRTILPTCWEDSIS